MLRIIEETSEGKGLRWVAVWTTWPAKALGGCW